MQDLSDHKELAIIKLKAYIDDRTKKIVHNAEQNIYSPQPLRYRHQITIEETLNNPNHTDTEGNAQEEQETQTYQVEQTKKAIL